MKIRLFSLLMILCLLLGACSSPSVTQPAEESTLGESEALFHFIDVGQGDSIFIQTDDAAVLIDAGTKEGGEAVYNYLQNLGIEYIDCFILTHPHDDHIGGGAEIIENFDVGNIYMNGESSSTYAFENLLDSIINNNLTASVPETGCVYKFGSLRVKFLTGEASFDNSNDNSLVVMVEHNDVKALFTGDAEKDVEEVLLEKADLKADILKVGHHGSRNASTVPFLREVLPQVSVIQCGEGNSYGHPHDEAVSRIESIGSVVLRTDESGTIVLRSNGSFVYDEEGNQYERLSEEALKEITYIGNKKSKVFHTEFCANLPYEKNSVIFSSPEEATEKGYKACRNCNP